MPNNTKKAAKSKTAPKGMKFLHVDEKAGGEPVVPVSVTEPIAVTADVVDAPKPTAKKPPVPKKKAPATEPAKAATLRKPQARILAYLAKQKRPSTRKQIADGAPVDTAMCTEYLGSDNDAIRLKNDALRFASLVTLGYIAATPGDTDEQPVTTYTITDAGREALKNAAK